MSDQLPVSISTKHLPLREAAMRAIGHIRDALESGDWSPSEARDPDYMPDTIEAHAETDVPVFDLAICRDLISISLSAIELGEWADATEEAISALQRFNFLTQVAEQLSPDRSVFEIGVAC